MLLVYLMLWLSPEQIEDGTVTDLISLLNIPDQAVRDGVAGALGVLRRRAKPNAAPKLQELLTEVDCRAATAGSAEIIREALDKMRSKAPPPNCLTARN